MTRDIRLSFRLLARTPTLTAVALLSIAITVGATAVVFAAVKSVLIQPLPYANAGDLVQLRSEYPKFGKSLADWVTWSDMRDLARSNRSFESLGVYGYALFNLSGDGSALPEALYGLNISANMFPTLGVKPMLGRNILPEEDQPNRNREMILSYSLWTRRFNSDRNIIGRSVEVNGHPCTIIGVMPDGFDFPMRMATSVRTPSQHMDFWAPLGHPDKEDRTSGEGAVARLRKGVSLAQAEQDVGSFSELLARRYPITNQDRVLHVGRLRDRSLGFAQTGLMLLMAAAAMFLLIGCANVANLLLARALARHREMAVRMALGAGRGRIARQLVTESSVLALLGGLLGYAFSVAAWTLLPAIAPMTIPRLAAARADGSVFAFTLAVSLINGLLFGIAPALRTSKRDPALALQESGSRSVIGRNRNGLRSTLVIAEVAVAMILVVIGGLLTGSFIRLLGTDTGFDADRVMASIIIPSGDRYQKNPETRGVLFQRILDSVRALPGVEQAGTVDALPFSGENNGGDMALDEGSNGQTAELDRVSSHYLEALGVPLLEGRWFRDDDMEASHDTALINDVAARLLWPGQSSIGKRFCIFCSNPNFRQWKQVVGVVKSIRHSGLDEPARSEVYYAGGTLQNSQFLVVRTSHPNAQLSRAIREAVASIDPQQPVFLSAMMSTLIGDSVADRRFIMTLLAITGCLALLLAAAGVYGVVSYATSLRRQEIGVRMALGATARDIHALIFRQGMSLAVIGAGVGLAAALILTRVLGNLLSPNPALIAMASAVVIVTAALACLIPAFRAAKVDPMEALRT